MQTPPQPPSPPPPDTRAPARAASPYLTARETYLAPPVPPVPWNLLLRFFLEHGGLVSSPHAFILARAVRRDDPPDSLRILHPPRPAADCWHIHLAAGNLSALAALRHIAPLPWVSWYRRDSGKLAVMSAAAVARLARSASPPSL